ncbi:MAG: cell division protein FtsQ/DivIB [Rhodoferax sp.]
MTDKLIMPVDVKLTNMVASLLLLVFALLSAASLADWAARQPLFALRAIAVSGELTHNNAVTLRANVAPRLSGTFFSMDLERARLAFETLPWVRKAVVRREFPNRLKVVLQEHKAVAYWGLEGEPRLVNSFGEVFEANVGEVEQESLPRLNGPDGQAQLVLAMSQTLRPLFEEMDMAIEQVELTGHGGWRLRLESGAQVELGAGSVPEVLARTQRFLSTLTQVNSRYGRKVDALEAADLRHEDGYAIRLRGVTTLAAGVQKK